MFVYKCGNKAKEIYIEDYCGRYGQGEVRDDYNGEEIDCAKKFAIRRKELIDFLILKKISYPSNLQDYLKQIESTMISIYIEAEVLKRSKICEKLVYKLYECERTPQLDLPFYISKQTGYSHLYAKYYDILIDSNLIAESDKECAAKLIDLDARAELLCFSAEFILKQYNITHGFCEIYSDNKFRERVQHCTRMKTKKEYSTEDFSSYRKLDANYEFLDDPVEPIETEQDVFAVRKKSHQDFLDGAIEHFEA